MVIAAQARGEDAFRLSHTLLRALWAEERDPSDPSVRIAVADENGYDGSCLQQLESAPETQALYERYTCEALEKGIFGAPTFVLDGERFWGQDRLLFVDRKLERMRSSGRGPG
jgi:2-hydroxychromene-2-carboxylate isomerase